jgi:hypothetical protein
MCPHSSSGSWMAGPGSGLVFVAMTGGRTPTDLVDLFR